MMVYILCSKADGGGGQYSGMTGIIDVFTTKSAAKARMKKENGGKMDFADYKFSIETKKVKE